MRNYIGLVIAAILVLASPSIYSYAVSTWPAANISGSMDLGSGTIRGGVFAETAAATGTESAAEGQWIFVTSAITRTLPAVVTSGQSLCYKVTAAVILTIDPASSDVIVLGNTVQTGGVTVVSSGVLGQSICLISNGTNWYDAGTSGIWEAGS